MTEYLASPAADPNAWIALARLVTMEAVLGIDNLIFISVLNNKLPPDRRASARRIGIAGAMVLRLLLIGTNLIAEGFGAHVPKGYIYAAMAFSALVEGLNMMSRRARARRKQAFEAE